MYFDIHVNDILGDTTLIKALRLSAMKAVLCSYKMCAEIQPIPVSRIFVMKKSG